jgi:CubicO group peptidase (beta-lactamase class C family)
LATLHGDSEIEHGSVFRYQTPKTDVVNWVTNRLTHRSLFDDLDQLWSVIGGGDEAYVLVDRTGAPVAGGGLNASPEDLARFCAFVLADTGDLISTAVLNRIQSGGSVDAFLAGPDALGVMTDGNWTYRAQWWVRNESGREAMTAIGVNGQWVYLDRKRGVGIVKQSSQPVAVDEQIDDLTIGVFDRIIDLVG